MAGETVRLRNSTTGVVVETNAEDAAFLSGFEPAEKSAPKKAAAPKSDNK